MKTQILNSTFCTGLSSSGPISNNVLIESIESKVKRNAKMTKTSTMKKITHPKKLF